MRNNLDENSALVRTNRPLIRIFLTEGFLLTAITVLSAVLRLRHLGGKSFWVDEAFSAVLAAAPWHVFWQQIRTTELNMVPYYLLLRGWNSAKCFVNPEALSA